MKRLRLFPRTFLYTLGLMLLVVIMAHIFLYLLAPRMQMVFSVGEYTEEEIVVGVQEERIVMQAVQRALPFSLGLCLLISLLCSFLFSRAVASPLEDISSATERMMRMERAAECPVRGSDEIGALARNVNNLYTGLLAAIENLEQEKERVREMEREKADFLRSASHELKTPVTALHAVLENMILGVGKYQNYAACLPECREMVEQLSEMIHEILEASRLNTITEEPKPVDVAGFLTELCGPYRLIASAHQTTFSVELPKHFRTALPVKSFGRAVSNILANAAAYTEAGKRIAVYMEGRSLVIENECEPVPEAEICRLFEPFYRPDFSRSREGGGNGLGLYIVDTLLTSMNISYSFTSVKSLPGMRFVIHLPEFF